MRGKQLVALVGIAAVTMTLAGTAAAQAPAKKAPKAPVKVVVATSAVSNSARVYVDSLGTVNVVWITQSSTGEHGYYARKPVGAKAFTRVALPNSPTNATYPFIYSPSHGVLQIIEDANDSPVAWRSTNDGKSWTTVSTAALMTAAGQNGSYVTTQYMADAPGGPIFDGSGGSINQLNPSLTTDDQIAPSLELEAPHLARSAAGTVFQVASGVQTPVQFGAGTHAGSAAFPACASAGDVGSQSVAAGKSDAVLVESACGHLWSRTISASGAVGKLVTIGRAFLDGSGSLGHEWASVVTDRSDHFTVAWVAPGGDLAISHSTDGSHWKTARGMVPISYQYSYLGATQTLSTGSPTWYIGTEPIGLSKPTEVRGLSLSSTYNPPAAPSGHGIPHAKGAHFGSLAVTVPGKVALKKFRKTGRVTFRLTDAIAGRVSVNVQDIRQLAPFQTEAICGSGAAKVEKLTPGHSKTVTLVCAGQTIVVGGSGGSGVVAKKGDPVSFTFVGRNGTFTVTSKVT